MNPLASSEGSVKLFVEDPSAIEMRELIPVFHRWIQQSLLENELLIDVTSYAHVPKGPGVVLIADLGHYYFESRHGRLGLRFRGRRARGGGHEDRLAHAFGSALRAAALLDADPALDGRYRFRTDELEFEIYDRLLAPSSVETMDAVRPELERFLRGLYGGAEVTLKMESGPGEPFRVGITTSSAPPLIELVDRLTAVPS